MKSLKLLFAVLLLSLFSIVAKAQDVVVIDSVNNVRGTIKGTDFYTVTLEKDDKSQVVYKAKDVKEFLWNGESYISKPVMNKNKMDARFFKVVEMGAVNLYSIGEGSAIEPKQNRVRVMPEIGIGLGSGGYGGGFGLGGGIAIGAGRNREKSRSSRHALYFIEKPGTGPMEEIQFNAGNSKERIKEILLSKLNNDEDLAQRIKDTDSFDAKSVAAFVKAYNLMHK
jgi:hypothetical protein